MQKGKSGVSVNKSKSRSPSPSPAPKKSQPKQKERSSLHSPRSTRIHTLEAKASPQLHKKHKNSMEIESPIRTPLAPLNNKEKDYETPKFKCETSPQHLIKQPFVHNFFSFGETEADKIGGLRNLRDCSNKIALRDGRGGARRRV